MKPYSAEKIKLIFLKAFVFNLPVAENQDCQLPFLPRQET